MAVGPVISAVQAVTDRSVDRSYSADLGTAEGATVDVLSRMGIRVESVDRSGEPWTIEGKGDGVTLYAKLGRLAGQLTKVSLRAENGGFSADKKTAEEILNQIALTLAPPVPTSSAEERAASAEAMATLKREIDRLGSKLDRLDGGAGNPAQPTPATFDTGRIVVVPPSAGVPSAATPEGMRLPALAETLEAARDPVSVESKAAVARESSGPPPALVSDAEGATSLLSPVESLTPVKALTGEGSAK